MYRNREGNKILLEIMENCPFIPLKDKINVVLENDKQSKYNQYRWAQFRGNRSTGETYTYYNNFSEAVSPRKRQTYNNTIK
jgi:hypothetical protein